MVARPLLVAVAVAVAMALAAPVAFARPAPRAASATDGPVIGVLSQPLNTTHTYIAASYVKFLESAGARVVPLLSSASLDALAAQFALVNAVLLPGGGMNLTDLDSAYMQRVGGLFALAVQANRNHDVFPVWGTCMGFEELSVVAAGTSDVLLQGAYDAENLPLALNFTAAAAAARMFADFPPELLRALATTPITINFHQDGVPPATYATNERLSAMFNVLATNADRKGRQGVAVVEGKDWPFYAVQFHPEKAPFEFVAGQDTPHTADAVAVSWQLGSFFVSEARKSTHAYPDDQLDRDLIYNYAPVHTHDHFVQVYVFPNTPSSP